MTIPTFGTFVQYNGHTWQVWAILSNGQLQLRRHLYPHGFQSAVVNAKDVQ